MPPSAMALGLRNMLGQIRRCEIGVTECLVQGQREMQVGAKAYLERAVPELVVQYVATTFAFVVQKMHVPARDADALLVQRGPETCDDAVDVMPMR